MAVELQKQIKDNSNDLSSYRGDLLRWTQDLDRQESRRERHLRGEKFARPQHGGVPCRAEAPPNVHEAVAAAALGAMVSATGQELKKGSAAEEERSPQEAPIKRDAQPMHQYYNSWDQFDADGEMEKLDEEAVARQRQERLTRQDDRDQILDEMALTSGGERTRTSKARPRVKIHVRSSGRRVAPVDLAVPRKEEANRYFGEGRFREAVAAYTAALDLLEKYEPKPSPGTEDGEEGDASEPTEGLPGDCAGKETEALTLKATLFANRAAAMLKLEEWREVVADCTEALRFEPQHAKAILRRGFAYARQRRWTPAARDLERAVANDPRDKKASAELQMSRRMLLEQAKEVRERARCTLIDPTRNLTMPTRRLNVRVRRRGAEGEEDRAAGKSTSSSSSGGRVNGGGLAPVAAGEPSSQRCSAAAAEEAPSTRPSAGAQTGAVCSGEAGRSQRSAAETAPASERSVSQPYVPKSVRMRGRRAAPAGAAASQAVPSGGGVGSAAIPPMNFYAFEAQWSRHRSKPAEQVALLRRLGARALPALFRESLDSELVASIVQALSGELARSHSDRNGVEDIGLFAGEVLSTLARTPRFDLSLRGLSAAERATCGEVVARLRELAACPEELLQDLLRAYSCPAAPAASAEAAAEEGSPPKVCHASVEGEALGFSLDDCD